MNLQRYGTNDAKKVTKNTLAQAWGKRMVGIEEGEAVIFFSRHDIENACLVDKAAVYLDTDEVEGIKNALEKQSLENEDQEELKELEALLVSQEAKSLQSAINRLYECSACEGTGYDEKNFCDVCGGSGEKQD